MTGVNAGMVHLWTGLLPSVEWKIPNFISLLRQFPTLEFMKSEGFSHESIRLEICLVYNTINFLEGYDRWLSLQVFQLGNRRDKADLFHNISIKRRDDSVYKCIEIERGRNVVYLMPVSELQRNMQEIAENGMTLILEFRPHDESSEYNSAQLSTSHESTLLSSPSNVVCCLGESAGLAAFSKNFSDSYLQEEYCDITINVGERQFRAHKFVLSARSPVFSAMMKHDMSEKNTNSVNVNDCEPDIFEKFLLYLYSGKVDKLSNENVLGLYTVADKYNVDYLKGDCVNYMERNLSVDAFCDFIELAAHHDESDLLNLSKEYFMKNARKILLSTNWQSFLRENSTLANELFLLVLPDN